MISCLSTSIPVFLIVDQNRPCHGEGVVRYPNIYYGGMFNEAMRLSDGSDWVCIITSDLVINDANKERIVSRMLEAVKISEIGCYQPSCDKRGRSHSHGYNQSRKHDAPSAIL